MASRSDQLNLLPIEDKRRRLTAEQKEEIRQLKGIASIHSTAKQYGVSRRTIQFIQYPERLVANHEARDARGGWQQYYAKAVHSEYTARCRAHKAQVIKETEI
jgi:transposase-like protein